MAMTATLGTDVPGPGNVQDDGKFYRAFGTIAASGSYATGGDALSFVGVVPVPNANKPAIVWVGGLNGYGYGYNKATGKIKVTTTSNTELAAGAYPAGITGDTIIFEALFPKV